MTLLLTAFIMIAFAATYASLFAMLGSRSNELAAALLGQQTQPQREGNPAPAVSRRLSRA
jgi:hypothetical protein